MVFGEDLKAALESSSRIKGCRVSVVEVNGLKETGVVKWEGISFYSSFVRKRKVCVLDMHLVLERGAFLPMNLAKEEPFSCKTTLGSACFKCQANDQNLFACEEAGCVKVFVTEAEVQIQMDTGEHLAVNILHYSNKVGGESHWCELNCGTTKRCKQHYIPGRVVTIMYQVHFLVLDGQ